MRVRGAPLQMISQLQARSVLASHVAGMEQPVVRATDEI